MKYCLTYELNKTLIWGTAIENRINSIINNLDRLRNQKNKINKVDTSQSKKWWCL